MRADIDYQGIIVRRQTVECEIAVRTGHRQFLFFRDVERPAVKRGGAERITVIYLELPLAVRIEPVEFR